MLIWVSSGLSASKHPSLNIGEGEAHFGGGKQCEVEISGFFQKIREKDLYMYFNEFSQNRRYVRIIIIEISCRKRLSETIITIALYAKNKGRGVVLHISNKIRAVG